MHVQVALRRCMAEESQSCRVSSNAACTLDHTCGLLLDAICQFSASIESVHPTRQRIACLQITGMRRPHNTSWDIPIEGPSLNAGKWLSDVETERSVKRERAVVVRGLHQPHSSRMTLLSSVHHRVHKLAPDAEVLYAWVDSNRSNTSDQGTLVETIASRDATLAFRDYAVKARTRKKH